MYAPPSHVCKRLSGERQLCLSDVWRKLIMFPRYYGFVAVPNGLCKMRIVPGVVVVAFVDDNGTVNACLSPPVIETVVDVMLRGSIINVAITTAARPNPSISEIEDIARP